MCLSLCVCVELQRVTTDSWLNSIKVVTTFLESAVKGDPVPFQCTQHTHTHTSWVGACKTWQIYPFSSSFLFWEGVCSASCFAWVSVHKTLKFRSMQRPFTDRGCVGMFAYYTPYILKLRVKVYHYTVTQSVMRYFQNQTLFLSSNDRFKTTICSFIIILQLIYS